MSTICIYHGNCADGFGAAWVVRKSLGEEVEFYPAKYGDAPPDVTGKDVIIVDFSYKRPVLLKMAETANTILVIDHHKTAAEDLINISQDAAEGDYCSVAAVFNMNHSGAMLTWKHFFPNEEPPTLLLHIEDRDLWKFALPNTRAVQANVFSYPYDFEVWDRLMNKLPSVLAMEGEAIERKHFKDMHELLGATRRTLYIGGHLVPAANLPYTMASDAGHEMAKRQKFAACYYDTAEGRVFSLRSNDAGLDVSEIAKLYGGGGHRNAAGFKVSFAEAKAFEVEK